MTVVTQRGQLSDEDKARLLAAQRTDAEANAAYRLVALEMMDKSSIRVVAGLLGKSTNTLQRWRNEAKR